eukprot:CAMPEP_0176221554 /NCGR_PEP_ID=MMETSP0121_2-20121125/19786_1 /TAXON_ID=160619 /ORGANISM="Kryptoperidinium foliaceum, Strain CCMP 1326" /LENGTH=61 /DNA_ID=CAMNT_0017560755 /DNA_START=376 /DNA_END=561 /DNA_ORIENTATION=-
MTWFEHERGLNSAGSAGNGRTASSEVASSVYSQASESIPSEPPSVLQNTGKPIAHQENIDI